MFAPGSPCLYLKLYVDPAAADTVLRAGLRPLVKTFKDLDGIHKWFFIRYFDPEFHIRCRVFGDHNALNAYLLPRINEALRELLDRGTLRRVDLSTYQRELERYGGPDATKLAEEIFWIDSEAVLDLIELYSGDALLECRWTLAARAVDDTLTGLGFNLGGKRDLLTLLRDAFGREFSLNTDLKRQLGSRFRDCRARLEEVLGRRGAKTMREFAPGLNVLARRCDRLRPLWFQLNELYENGRVGVDLADLAASYVHMHLNRILRDQHRAQELVIYDFLRRTYDSELVRSQQ